MTRKRSLLPRSSPLAHSSELAEDVLQFMEPHGHGPGGEQFVMNIPQARRRSSMRRAFGREGQAANMRRCLGLGDADAWWVEFPCPECFGSRATPPQVLNLARLLQLQSVVR